MSVAQAPRYEDSVFINCPFDQEYERLFQALFFAIHDCGFVARCALEASDSGEARIKKILDIIDAETTIEVFAPPSVNRIVWNGSRVDSQRTSYGTLQARVSGPVPVQLPSLASWKFQLESFERETGFDDST